MKYGPVYLILFILAVVAVFMGDWMCSGIEDDRLRKHGVEARAIILKVEDTGNRFNDNPEVVFTLEVHRDGKGAYQTEHKRVYSVVDLLNYPKGTEVTIKVDPEDSTSLVIIEPVTSGRPTD